uniref:Uncharacterized protein n=1 Tax=Anopheles darlingi TaxID=43151 RepID=A0A2M4CKN7_ANODA
MAPRCCFPSPLGGSRRVGTGLVRVCRRRRRPRCGPRRYVVAIVTRTRWDCTLLDIPARCARVCVCVCAIWLC